MTEMLTVIRNDGFSTEVRGYASWPKTNVTPDGYYVVVNGEKFEGANVAVTGGGIFPSYTYLRVAAKDGKPFSWYNGVFASGSELKMETPEPKVKPVLVKAEPPKDSPAEVKPEPKLESLAEVKPVKSKKEKAAA